ncbi:alpha/beta fold hydrolase [Streptomyces sp. SID8382]|uniref:alpha/beta fold hydrolase n=1 Tax=Streptomyces malaysiensis TaxID=92644 RepID=UPI000C2B946D|nr:MULTISPECIES: alpha/beta hydrolase [unclassified Streptomyces]AUA16833.1 short chain dehydrogenase [Streptomyces sp. M56]MYX58034.1 alpha/beta fold hydrolase [Streptomyces sp. SID8382]
MRIRTPRRVALAAGALLLLGATTAPGVALATDDGSSAASASPKPTVVLVHGAWADSSSWSSVMERLRKDGYPVRAIANPLRGLTSDTAYVSSYLSTIDGPVVLVGHSYGGAVITNSAASDPDVKALVYIAGFIPAKGETVGDLAAKSSPPIPLISTAIPGGTDVSIDPAHFREVFAGDVDETTAANLAAVQRPANTKAVSGAGVEEAFRTIPSWSLITRQDHAIAPDVQRFMSKRAGSHTEEVNASHAVMISRPDAVTHMIEDAARDTR